MIRAANVKENGAHTYNVSELNDPSPRPWFVLSGCNASVLGCIRICICIFHMARRQLGCVYASASVFFIWLDDINCVTCVPRRVARSSLAPGLQAGRPSASKTASIFHRGWPLRNF